MQQIRVRFAPSPTGHLHIGSARTALFNWLFARSCAGRFILRIEDTDAARSKKEYLDSILRDLKWLGLDWDEGPDKGGAYGPYFQTQRLDTYKNYAEKLLSVGKAYYCFCSKEELEKEREEKSKLKQDTGYSGKCRDLSAQKREELLGRGAKPVVRFKTEEGTTRFTDLVRGELEFNNNTIEDFVIIKSDGIPVYNFAAVIDDYLMKISHVIRGEEHISNTPRQILIADSLGIPVPQFAHIPIVLNPDKTKLSKRAGAANLDDFAALGYLPEGLINFLTLLGWSYGDDIEIMKAPQIIKKFSLGRVIAHAAVFDDKKLDAVNASHIRMMTDSELARVISEFGRGRMNRAVDESMLDKLVALYKERVKTLKDFFEQAAFFFEDITEYDADAAAKYFKGDFLSAAFEKIIAGFSLLEDFNAQNTETVLRGIADSMGLGAGKLIHPVRLAVSGRTATPGLFDILAILGKDKVIERMKKVIESKIK